MSPRLLAVALVIASPLAFAQPPSPAQAPVDVDATTDDDLFERTCLRHTGSRIPTRSATRSTDARDIRRACSPAFGRVYTRKDIDRTGRVDIADALRALDPAIR